MEVRYGINPEQPARASAVGRSAPLEVIAGAPSYVNLLDALNAWQLVADVSDVLQRTAAASFKHVSPAGVATNGPLDAVAEETWGVSGTELSDVAAAYVRARDSDPKASYGDFVAVSEPVDAELAAVLATVVSDGIIAPGYEPGVLSTLAAKKRGTYLVLEADRSVELPEWERRDVLGLTLEQRTARQPITPAAIESQTTVSLAPDTVDDLVLAMITARYTQSNSVVYAKDGQVLGVGAGQQSRVDCTKLAGAKVDTWWLRRHPNVGALRFKQHVKRQDRINWRIRYIEGDMTEPERQRFLDAIEVGPASLSTEERLRWLDQLDGLAFASDGYIPFRDNIDQAARRGVRYIAHPGGSARSAEVDEAADEHGILIVETGIRLFHH